MNKSELINSIAEKSGLLKKDAAKALDAFIESVEEAVENGQKVLIVGFGTFQQKKRAERKGRNPQTLKEITIPASSIPTFSAGKEFKIKVNK